MARSLLAVVVVTAGMAACGATISLNDVLKNSQVPYGYKLVDGNVGVMGKKITLPHYMAMFI